MGRLITIAVRVAARPGDPATEVRLQANGRRAAAPYGAPFGVTRPAQRLNQRASHGGPPSEPPWSASMRAPRTISPSPTTSASRPPRRTQYLTIAAGGEGFTRQAVAKEDAWFAGRYAAQPYIADGETHIHEIVRSHAPGNQVSARQRQIGGSVVLGAEEFDLFSLDQREVLTRVGTLAVVPVTQDSHPAMDRDAFTRCLSHAALRADEDAFDDHRGLLTYDG